MADVEQQKIGDESFIVFDDGSKMRIRPETFKRKIGTEKVGIDKRTGKTIERDVFENLGDKVVGCSNCRDIYVPGFNVCGCKI